MPEIGLHFFAPLPQNVGWSWDRKLFPRPASFVRAVKELGVQAVAVNVHPASGVLRGEDCFGRLRERLTDHSRELELQEHFPLPLLMSTEANRRAFGEECLQPLGVDVWWIDWQQGEDLRLVLTTSSGSGAHAVEKEFLVPQDATPTAELSRFFAGFGSVSPVLRLHSSRLFAALGNDRDPGQVPEPFRGAIVEALQFRELLRGYLEFLGREMEAHGVAPLRPLYWYHAWEEEAYWHEGSGIAAGTAARTYGYYLGTRLLCFPVTRPSNLVTGWLPPAASARPVISTPPSSTTTNGSTTAEPLRAASSPEASSWMALHSGAVVARNPTTGLFRQYASLSTIPVLARVGSVLPFGRDTLLLFGLKGSDRGVHWDFTLDEGRERMPKSWYLRFLHTKFNEDLLYGNGTTKKRPPERHASSSTFEAPRRFAIVGADALQTVFALAASTKAKSARSSGGGSGNPLADVLAETTSASSCRITLPQQTTPQQTFEEELTAKFSSVWLDGSSTTASSDRGLRSFSCELRPPASARSRVSAVLNLLTEREERERSGRTAGHAALAKKYVLSSGYFRGQLLAAKAQLDALFPLVLQDEWDALLDVLNTLNTLRNTADEDNVLGGAHHHAPIEVAAVDHLPKHLERLELQLSSISKLTISNRRRAEVFAMLEIRFDLYELYGEADFDLSYRRLVDFEPAGVLFAVGYPVVWFLFAGPLSKEVLEPLARAFNEGEYAAVCAYGLLAVFLFAAAAGGVFVLGWGVVRVLSAAAWRGKCRPGDILIYRVLIQRDIESSDSPKDANLDKYLIFFIVLRGNYTCKT
eukprot:g9125.t1